MKNEENFNKVARLPNTRVHSIFNLAIQTLSVPLNEFIYGSLDLMDFKFMFPRLNKKKVLKALKENRIVPFLTDKGYFGWIAEVSFPKIINEEMHIHEIDEYCSVFYDEDYQGLIDQIMVQSKKYVVMDLEKLKKRKYGTK